MGHKSKKAATEKTSGKSVQTYAAESTQEQPLTRPDGTTSETASDAAGAEVMTTKSQPVVTVSKMSPQEQQYLKAIALSSAELGAVIEKSTERVTNNLGEAIGHEAEAKRLRLEAKQEFDDNIAFYYEAKQRLLNPGYRTDVDGGKDRTADDNQKWFGAPNWEAFNDQCHAYSLQHADRKLKLFAKEQGLLSDGGANIDDPDQKEDEPDQEEGEPEAPEARRTTDPTAQKMYEHIATVAMSIAQSDPQNPVSKQIMAAAVHVPAPLMPVTPDIYTEVISFVAAVSQLVAKLAKKKELKPLIEPLGNVKQLLSKLSLHRPTPEPPKILAEATKEEERKRHQRLAKKNGQALGSASYHPPNYITSEHVQQSQPMSEGQGAIPSCKAVAPLPKTAPKPRAKAAGGGEAAATPMDFAQAPPANGVSKRCRLIEHTIGSRTELVIMDGNKVCDCFSLDEKQEAQAMLDKLNATAVAKPESRTAAA